MTVLNTDNNQEAPLNQEKIDTNLTQVNSDVNMDQNNPIQNTDEQTDPNWKAFREARKKDRLEKEAAERRASEKEAEVTALKAAMEAAFSKSAPTAQAYNQYYGINEDHEETEDQRLEKKVNALLAAKEQKYAQDQQERERKEYPNRLSKDFPDFGHVCSQENLDYLDYHYPELSRPLQRLPEGYDKWSDIYHAVKKFIPNHLSAKKEAARADSNMLKPKSISSNTQSPNGGPVIEGWKEAEQRKSENWARMQRILKGV